MIPPKQPDAWNEYEDANRAYGAAMNQIFEAVRGLLQAGEIAAKPFNQGIYRRLHCPFCSRGTSKESIYLALHGARKPFEDQFDYMMCDECAKDLAPEAFIEVEAARDKREADERAYEEEQERRYKLNKEEQAAWRDDDGHGGGLPADPFARVLGPETPLFR